MTIAGTDEDEQIEERHESSDFDIIINAFEELLVDPEFSSLQGSLLEKHSKIISDKCANDLFNEYKRNVGKFIESRFNVIISGFTMSRLFSVLNEHQEIADTDIFDVVNSLNDIESYKDLVLNYCNGNQDNTKELSDLLYVRPLK
ncbi:hypothetical protein ROZALSC1DRAFT_21144 [Rozella allomycis CSF55]|uniref:ADP-ribosylation factor-like protein 2-binding protein n=1 Tax=Rozella allomycis (strain CSF55) TaxID=988480 RepID=A0A4P9YM24_ROZAC|nr:hypothetical protein ROZALSC1DRAFT_21144 [Rozella allomycis CSF55]